MNKRSSPSLSFGTASQPVSEQKPGRPDMPWIVLRLVVMLCVFLIAATDSMQSWANGTLIVQEGLVDRTSVVGNQTWATAVQSVATFLIRQDIYRIITVIAAGGVLLFLAECIFALWRIVAQRHHVDRAAYTYMRIRPLRPQSRKVKASTDPVDFWRSLHAVLQQPTNYRTVPWIGFTLHAQPQQPVTLGAVIVDGGGPVAPPDEKTSAISRSRRMRSRTATGQRALAPVNVTATQVSASISLRQSLQRALTKMVLGQDAETIVDEIPDPLAAVLTPGRVLCWRELRLTKPAHFLIRTPADFTNDALGTIAAALRTPAGVVHTEVQVIVRPRIDLDLLTSWRVFARRRYIGVRRKDVLGTTTETKTLEAKLNSEAYDVTLRLLAVADTQQAVPAARSALRELQSAFGQYQTRTAVGVQRFRATGVVSDRIVPIPQPPSVQLPAALFQHGVGLVLVLGAAFAVTFTASRPMIGIGIPLALLVLWCYVIGWRKLAAQPGARVIRRAPRLSPSQSLILPAPLWPAPTILGCDEVAGLWHLPSVELKTLINWLPNRFLPAQPHTFIPNGATDRLVLGYAMLSDGTEAPVGPSLRALRQVLHLTAGMGAGKTRALANAAQQFIPNGMILGDGKGDDVGGSLAATTLKYIPLEDEHRLVLIDVLDAEWPIGLNPLYGIDTSSAGGMTQAMGMILALFARLDPETWSKSQGMQQYAQMGSALVIEAAKNPTFATLKQAIQDENYRVSLLPYCTNIEVKNFWEVTFPQTGEQQKSSRDALLRRLDNLMVDETTRYLLTQPEPTVDFLRCMEEGRIVIMPLPHRTLGGMAEFIGMLLLQSVMRAAFRRPGSDQTRTTVPLIIDELQIFIGDDGKSKDIQDAITQLRGFGIGGIYAHQTLVQLGDLRDEMLTNSANRMILRTQEPDASAYAKQFPTTDLTAADISGQDYNEHQYVVFAGGEGPPEVCSIRPLMWPAPLDTDRDLPDYNGPDWQTLTPLAHTEMCAAEREDGAATLEMLLARMVYGKIDMQYVSAQLALLPDDVWEYIRTCWKVVANYQRQYILDNPHCIAFDPDFLRNDPNLAAQLHDDPAQMALLQRQDRRNERQRWLSRLETRMPRVLSAAGYQRQRWMLDPNEQPAPVQERKVARVRPAREAYSPASTAILFTPSGAEAVPPSIRSEKTSDEVMQEIAQERLVIGEYAAVDSGVRKKVVTTSAPLPKPVREQMATPDDDTTNDDVFAAYIEP